MALGITVDINANLARFEQQINRLGDNLQGFQHRTEGMSSAVNKALGALGVGVSIAGIGAFVKSGIDAADALNDMADRTGIAVEKLAGWQLVVKTADTDMETFAKSVNKLSIFIAKNGDEMRRLGVSSKDPNEAMLQLADVFSKIEDPQRRAALAATILGKSYADMAPALLQGSDAIRKQIDKGQKMSGVTTEQAKAAADLNDKIDTLNRQFASLTLHTVGPLIPGLGNIAEHFDYAAKSAKGFSDVFTADFWDRVIAGSDPEMAISGIKKLDGLIKDQEGVITRIQKHPKLAALENYDIGEEQRKLEILVQRRGDAVKKLSMQTVTPQTPTAHGKPTNNRAINNILGGKDGKVEQDAADQLKKRYEDLYATMSREVSLRGDNTEAAKMEYEVINGSLAGLSEGQKLKLRNLAAEKDAINANTKAIEKYKELEQKFDAPLFNFKKDISDAMDAREKGIIPDDAKLKLALDKMGKDYNAMTRGVSADYDRLNQKFNAPLLDLNAGIDDAMLAREQGIIPNDAQLKLVLDQMGKDYNALTDDAKSATAQMSEFAVQAAHNMESAFADFLFDPFKDGLDGMGENFIKILQRMAAEAASAQIFNSLLGKNYGAENATGGLLSAAFTGASTLLGGLWGGGATSVAAGNSEAFSGLMSSSSFWTKHAGGLIGDYSAEKSVNPAIFNSATRYHSGGIPGLKPNEVPIIALNDEEVLTRTDPRHRYNLGNRPSSSGAATGDISITTQVTVTGGSDNSNTSMQALGSIINTRVRQVIAEEKRPNGLLA